MVVKIIYTEKDYKIITNELHAKGIYFNHVIDFNEIKHKISKADFYKQKPDNVVISTQIIKLISKIIKKEANDNIHLLYIIKTPKRQIVENIINQINELNGNDIFYELHLLNKCEDLEQPFDFDIPIIKHYGRA